MSLSGYSESVSRKIGKLILHEEVPLDKLTALIHDNDWFVVYEPYHDYFFVKIYEIYGNDNGK